MKICSSIKEFSKEKSPKKKTQVKDGWFVLKGIAAGDRIVVKGSQLLMSEESRSQIQVGD